MGRLQSVAIFGVWLFAWYVASLVEFAGVFIVLSLLVCIFTVGLKTDSRSALGYSAYSVFNSNFETILGTTTAAQFENEILRRPLNAEARRPGGYVGGAGRGRRLGSGNASDDTDDAEELEERQLQEALLRSMAHTHGKESANDVPVTSSRHYNKKKDRTYRKQKKQEKLRRRAKEVATAQAASILQTERIARKVAGGGGAFEYIRR